MATVALSELRRGESFAVAGQAYTRVRRHQVSRGVIIVRRVAVPKDTTCLVETARVTKLELGDYCGFCGYLGAAVESHPGAWPSCPECNGV